MSTVPITNLPGSAIVQTLPHDLAPEDDTIHDTTKTALDQHIEVVKHQGVIVPAYISYTSAQSLKAFKGATAYCAMVAVGAMYDAYVLSVPQNLLANIGFVTKMATLEVRGVPTIDPTAITIWNVLYTVAGFVTMLIAPTITDRFGRRAAFYCLVFTLLGDGIVGVLAQNWHSFCLARWFSGMSSGFVQVGLNTYLSEVAPTNSRGTILTMYAIMFAVGGLLGTVALNEIANYNPMMYQIVYYTEFGVLSLFLPAVLFAPESPGKEELAKKSMRRLYGSEPSYDVDAEYLLILAGIEQRKSLEALQNGGFKQYLECLKGTNLRRTAISIIPLLFQTMSGLIIFLGYTAFFFAEVSTIAALLIQAGYAKPFQAGVIIQSILLASVICSTFIIDKLGRRPLLIGGLFVCFLCNLSIGSLSFLSVPNGPAEISLACIWAIAYSMSLGPMGECATAQLISAWTYLGETSTIALRAKTLGVGTAFNTAFNLIWSYTIPIILSPAAANWGLKAGAFDFTELKSGFLFAGTTGVGCVLCYFVMPETSRRSFEEIDEMFNNRVPTRQFKTYKTQVQANTEEASARDNQDDKVEF